MIIKPLWKNKLNVGFIWMMLITGSALFWFLTLVSVFMLAGSI